jgi:hypothetical protein
MCCRSSPSLSTKSHELKAEILSSTRASCARSNVDHDDDYNHQHQRLGHALRQTIRGWTHVSEASCELIASKEPTTDSPTPQSGPNSKQVRFDHVRIRYHSPVLSDHPECREGAPVELSWMHFREAQLSVDEHEILSTASPRKNRGRDGFRLTPLQRHYRLASAGYCPDEIKAAQSGILRVQRQRNETRRRLGSSLGRLSDRIQEHTEDLCRSASSLAAIRRRNVSVRPLPKLVTKALENASF